MVGHRMAMEIVDDDPHAHEAAERARMRALSSCVK